jgi:hypothetical protein
MNYRSLEINLVSECIILYPVGEHRQDFSFNYMCLPFVFSYNKFFPVTAKKKYYALYNIPLN